MQRWQRGFKSRPSRQVAQKFNRILICDTEHFEAGKRYLQLWEIPCTKRVAAGNTVKLMCDE